MLGVIQKIFVKLGGGGAGEVFLVKGNINSQRGRGETNRNKHEKFKAKNKIMGEGGT